MRSNAAEDRLPAMNRKHSVPVLKTAWFAFALKTNLLSTLDVAAALFTAWTGSAQGTIAFTNSSPVYGPDCVTPLAGAACVAELFAGPGASELLPVGGSRTPFLSGARAGYWKAITVSLPCPAASVVWLQARAYEASYLTCEDAVADGGLHGESRIIAITCPSSVPPPPPQPIDFGSFCLSAQIRFLVQPTSVTATVGATVEFSAELAGSGPFYCQWAHEGNTLAGATTASLTLTNVQPADAGTYVLSVSNAVASATSEPARLVLLDLQMCASLAIVGASGATYRIDYTRDPANPAWVTLTNLTIPQSPFLFVDLDSRGQPRRFYRAVPVP